MKKSCQLFIIMNDSQVWDFYCDTETEAKIIGARFKQFLKYPKKQIIII